ncbi:HesA/MoeB/ThiF family protein [Kiritimatiella glycovorans]|uniref:Putative adenylyltransferase/sulfurtransferase MoeZ n=1 Tax=Kiritimatiella glycovorans TaxID=1307763 RepID=A0A0G3EER6_9BACT|nr:HesA/MoeB/ThiF family protein [Kiritimatiella glycovorans]AKJ64976.1 putative adenylyltransferase/sulfurtransferase MoeZ [Kiritimatiella glycovorans]
MNFEARYRRQLDLPEIGPEGQRRLAAAAVLVAGAGGLGSPALLYLAAAGVGRLRVADPDRVQESNLQRQVLYAASDVGRLKAEAAAERLAALNPGIRVESEPRALDEAAAPSLMEGVDVVLAAVDRFAPRAILAREAHRLGRPYVHAGLAGCEGEVMTVRPGESPCYRCVFPELPPDGNDRPVGPPGPLPGVLGALQAMEAIKLICGFGTLLTGVLLRMDLAEMSFRRLPVKRNADCPVCGRRSS